MAILISGTSSRNSAATIYAPSEIYHDPATLTLDNGPVGASVTWLPARRIASVALTAFAVNLLTSTLAPASAMPFGQNDWPNPASRARSILVSVSSQPQAAPGTPTYQTDWPNPLVLRTFRPVPPPNLLGTTLAPVVSVAPFSQAEWPNPLIVRRRVPPTASNLLMEVPDDLPYGQAYFPDRVHPRRPWVLTSVSSQPQAAPGTPTYQTDWPNPLVLRTFRPVPPPNLLGTTLAPAAGTPFVPVAWPNPPLVKQQPQIGWSQDRKAYYQDVKPFALTDWITPLTWRATRVDPVPNLLAATLAPAPTTKPFLQSEWPNPAPVRQQTAAGWTQDRKAYYQDAAAFSLTDWPTPLRLKTSRAFDVQNLLTGTLSVPFNQPDWPAPLRSRLLSVVDVPNLLTTTLAPSLVSPFNQDEWPTPLGPKRVLFVVAPNVTISLPLPAVPVVQSEWPIPRRATVVNRGFTQDTARHLIGKDTFFAGPGRGPTYDYPNPRYKGRASDLVTWTQGRQFYYVEPPPGEPCEIIVSGSYQQIVTVTGSYKATIDVSGSYNPTIVIPGDHC